ncbi:MAG: aldo/keto reductase [Myxococcales bacterium]|nr:aldo/keto reductase [Myxococcales bacterium]
MGGDIYYRMLGNTGLQVSVLSYGFWATFGVKQGLTEDQGVAAAKEILHAARQGGINLFDNAEAYGNPNGEAETIMGEAIAQLSKEHPELWHRQQIVITTKIFWGGSGVNQTGLSHKHVREGLDAALARLQADYVDLVFCHRPDPHTPTETVVRAMTQMVRSGRATAWGTSEWSAQQITEAFWLARTLGLEPPQFEQPQYSLIHRERPEREYAPLYQQPYRMGLTTWSPLASGILTGKYNDSIPEGSRMTQPGYEFLHTMLQGYRDDGTLDKVARLTQWARSELDCSVAQLAIAWVARNSNVSTVLLGATKLRQLEENLGAISVLERLTDEHMAAIDEIMGNKPADYEGWGGTGRRRLETI